MEWEKYDANLKVTAVTVNLILILIFDFKWFICSFINLLQENCFVIKQMIKDLYLETTEVVNMALWSDEQIRKIKKKTIHKNSSRALMRNRIMCDINYFHSFLNVFLLRTGGLLLLVNLTMFPNNLRGNSY